jgi:hypothetical protein
MTFQSPIHTDHDQAVLDSLAPLREAGFALHYLHPRTKRPIGDDWSTKPVLSLEDLRRTHRPGNNLGVRLGEPSALVCGDYLHTFDLDIHVPGLAGEAREALSGLFPGLQIDSLPAVISGSGGESRHLYFVTDRPFFSKSLAHSDGKVRVFDKTKGRDVWKYEWSIELFGSGKQVVLPPSIHPDTGQPYRWLRPFNFDMLRLGVGPFIPSADIERIAEAVAESYEFERREPLTFEPGQLERDLDDVPLDRIDDYHDWIALGQALHHQFGASDAGFDRWIETSKRSAKFDQNDMRELRRKWRGFGRNRRQPVTMGTVRQWAIDARHAARVAELTGSFDEEPEDENSIAVVGADHLLASKQQGAAEDWTTSPRPNELTPEIDALLGAPEPVDPIDGIGSVDAALSHSCDWLSLLDIEPEKGAIRPTLHNLELIIKNDARLAGLAQINEFTQETVQRATPGTKAARRRAAKPTRQLAGRIWHVRDPLNGDIWNDDRDLAVRTILEAPKTQGGYAIKVTDRDLRGAIVLASHDNAFHPVREYLERLTWDGQPRAETLFVDYLGAEDTAYTRQVARLMLAAAVTRIFEPGHKWDFTVILEGLQGRRKSTFIRILGRSWFAELDGSFDDAKQMIELMQGSWIMEIPELSSFNRAEVRSIKAFISRQEDKARLAYARRATTFSRQCIFIGSTNDREYLKDDTGGRRFWPMPCNVEEIDTERLEREVDQIWAEAVVLYQQMRREQPLGTLPLYLSGEALRTAQEYQESRRVETEADSLAGEIAAWLDKPIVTGSLDSDAEQPKQRMLTCLKDIWLHCLCREARSYDRSANLALGAAMRLVKGWEYVGHRNFGPLGTQRAYGRGGRYGCIGV